jgi:hypothetical protein
VDESPNRTVVLSVQHPFVATVSCPTSRPWRVAPTYEPQLSKVSKFWLRTPEPEPPNPKSVPGRVCRRPPEPPNRVKARLILRRPLTALTSELLSGAFASPARRTALAASPQRWRSGSRRTRTHGRGSTGGCCRFLDGLWLNGAGKPAARPHDHHCCDLHRLGRPHCPRPPCTTADGDTRFGFRPAAGRAFRSAATQAYRPAATQPYRPAATQAHRPAATQPYRPAATQPYRSAATQAYRQAATPGFLPGGDPGLLTACRALHAPHRRWAPPADRRACYSGRCLSKRAQWPARWRRRPAIR